MHYSPYDELQGAHHCVIPEDIHTPPIGFWLDPPLPPTNHLAIWKFKFSFISFFKILAFGSATFRHPTSQNFMQWAWIFSGTTHLLYYRVSWRRLDNLGAYE